MPTPSARPLFGRSKELATLRDRLSGTGIWLVQGPPGIGKTRLVEVAADTWPEEVVWVGLGGVTTAPEVIARVAAALGIDVDPPPVGMALLGRPGLLLVIDEAETAADAFLSLLAAWRNEAPHLRCLIASQRRVDGVDGTLALEPLSLDDAAALYTDRATTVALGVVLDQGHVRALVEALDGLPLAVELAAARVRTHPPERLLAAFDRGERVDQQQRGRPGSLEAALDVSVALLEPAERSALVAATRLLGSFDSDAFIAVTGCDAEVLDALLDASLVQLVAPGALRLLETVRRYAARLGPDPESDHRHTAWALAEGEFALSQAQNDGVWGRLLALRRDLVEVVGRGGADGARAALVLGELAVARGPADDVPSRDVPLALQARLGFVRSRILRRRRQHEAALAVLTAIPKEAPVDAALAVRLEAERAMHLIPLNRTDEAQAALDRGDAFADRVADPTGLAELRLVAAVSRLRQGDAKGAAAALQDGRAALADAGTVHPELTARLDAHLGTALRSLGELERAAACFERAIAHYAKVNDPRWEGIVTGWLGTVLWDVHDLEEASARLLRSADLCARAGDPAYESGAYLNLAGVRLEEGAYDESMALLDKSRDMPSTTPHHQATVRGFEGLLHHHRGEIPLAITAYRAALGAMEELGLLTVAASFRPFLVLALAERDPDQAAPALAHAEAAVADLDPGYRLLVELVRQSLAGGVRAETREEARGIPRIDLRLMLGLVDDGVRVAKDGTWLSAAEGKVDLARRPVLRRVLVALIAAGTGSLVTRDSLIEAGWPGERILLDSAHARLHVAVSTLRKLGLGEALVTGDVAGDVAYGLAGDVILQ